MRKLFAVFCMGFLLNSCSVPAAVVQEAKKKDPVTPTYCVGRVPVIYKFCLWPVAPNRLFSLSFSPAYDWPMDWPNNRW
jgi:hypothetical protein